MRKLILASLLCSVPVLAFAQSIDKIPSWPDWTNVVGAESTNTPAYKPVMIDKPLNGAFDTGMSFALKVGEAQAIAPNGLVIDLTSDPHPDRPAVVAIIKVGNGKRCLIEWQGQCIISGTHLEVK